MIPKMNRRSFLGHGLAAGAGAVLLDRRQGRFGSSSVTASGGANGFTTPLPVPEYLTTPDIALTAAEAEVPILPGAPTRMWTFNGQFPGPIIRRPSGEPTRVHVSHSLPPDVGSLTIHHHGNHSAPEHDGQPGRQVIEPGDSRTYVYELMEDGAPERGAFQWYHDHSHFRTGRNTWNGLVGGFIIEDGFDAGLGLPSGEFDVPLIVTDREFDADNQLVQAFSAPGREQDTAVDALMPGSGYPPGDETAGVGQTILTNGVPRPYLDVAARRYRIRILNASNFRPYNFALSNRMPFQQVATESGLLPAPIERTSLLLGPAERAEIVVDFTGLTDQNLVLESVPETDSGYVPYTAPPSAPIMMFCVGAAATDDGEVPPELRPLPDWTGELSETPDRVWAFGLGIDEAGRPAWTINGRAFDPSRTDAFPELGTTETWMLVNTTPLGISHYIHIHDVDWKMLSRNGNPPAAGEAGLKETFRLDPGEVVVVGSKFTDHTGPYMLHCHMLEHEDHGMMTNWEVVEPGAASPIPGIEATLEAAERHRVRAVLDDCGGGQPASLAAIERQPMPRVAADTNPWFCDLGR